MYKEKWRILMVTSDGLYNLNMNVCLQFLCCCCCQPGQENPETIQVQPRKKKVKSQPKHVRLVTKYSKA